MSQGRLKPRVMFGLGGIVSTIAGALVVDSSTPQVSMRAAGGDGPRLAQQPELADDRRHGMRVKRGGGRVLISARPIPWAGEDQPWLMVVLVCGVCHCRYAIGPTGPP